jgi:pimeloyl-ACP methyl ester carboxylesterase
MPALRGVVIRCWIVGVLLLAMLWPASSLASGANGTSPISDAAPVKSVYLRMPHTKQPRTSVAPLQVLVALHGMGSSGEVFSKDLTEQADTYGWVIVAPTIAYGNWQDPAVVTREEPALIAWLSDYLDKLPANIGQVLRRRVLLLGHSRGAQLAHRFAEARPDQVLGVAALSAGDYTLPVASGTQGALLTFPFGVGDLARYTGQPFDRARFDTVQFFVGVGGNDSNPADVPHQWDYEGTTRLQRAEAFVAAMKKLGAQVELTVFPGVDHTLTPEMRSAACRFLDGVLAVTAARPRGPVVAMPG